MVVGVCVVLIPSSGMRFGEHGMCCCLDGDDVVYFFGRGILTYDTWPTWYLTWRWWGRYWVLLTKASSSVWTSHKLKWVYEKQAKRCPCLLVVIREGGKRWERKLVHFFATGRRRDETKGQYRSVMRLGKYDTTTCCWSHTCDMRREVLFFSPSYINIIWRKNVFCFFFFDIYYNFACTCHNLYTQDCTQLPTAD